MATPTPTSHTITNPTTTTPSSPPSKPLTLITGSSGHLGFAILTHLLRAGHRVRALLRSEAKADLIRSAPSVAPYLKHDNDSDGDARLSFMVEPDFLAPGALEKAMEDGVECVVHVAAQIIDNDLDFGSEEAVRRNWIGPNVEMTVGVLRAAARSEGVRRVVVTSSASAMIPDLWRVNTGAENEGMGEGKVFELVAPGEVSTVETRPAVRELSGGFANAWDAYDVSKAMARREAERFMRNEGEGVGFDLVQVMPSLTLGRMELARNPMDYFVSGNVAVFASAVGFELPHNIPDMVCSLEDVAEVHVKALDEGVVGRVEGGVQSFGVSLGPVVGIDWDGDVKRIVREQFEKEVEAGVLPCSGKVGNLRVPIDARKTEEVFGMKFRNMDEMVKDAVGGYLELLVKMKGQNGEVKA